MPPKPLTSVKYDHKIHGDLIAKLKWVLSENAGRDIGTAATVDRMLSLAHSTLIRGQDFVYFNQMERGGQSGFSANLPPREDLIVNYLINHETLTSNTPNLVGELKRFGAGYWRCPEEGVRIEPHLFGEFTRISGLSSGAYEKLREQLWLEG